MAIEKGKLVRWIDEKGFGFIKTENGKNDIFIHISALKNMSRKPVIGDIILFEINVDTNGKLRAINALIEGVSQNLTLTPLDKQSKPTPSTIQEKTRRIYKTKVSKPKNAFSLIPVLAIAVMIIIFSWCTNKRKVVLPENTLMSEIQDPIPIVEFKCEGKTHCSQMGSYEEAKFYLDNCPGTEMDGDRDGEPCEQQF